MYRDVGMLLIYAEVENATRPGDRPLFCALRNAAGIALAVRGG